MSEENFRHRSHFSKHTWKHKALQAADLIGYDGTRLRKSVDHIKEANEKHNQDVEKMARSRPDQ